ncbi:MAG: hypothetical protein HRT82_00725 [Henriciella sp.]|nr:hypothetical protein [Henriciella sp.]
MLPVPASWAIYLAVLTGIFLFLLGTVFMLSPKQGFAMTKHRAENLPTIMAGRYFFMVLIAVGVALTGSLVQLAFVFLCLAGVAFFDAAVYARAKTKVAPHLAAGVGAVLVAFIALEGQV